MTGKSRVEVAEMVGIALRNGNVEALSKLTSEDLKCFYEKFHEDVEKHVMATLKKMNKKELLNDPKFMYFHVFHRVKIAK